jgi:hypothetical protein
VSFGQFEPHWPAIPGVRAHFTLRTGGVSEGRHASLNLAAHVGDTPAAVAANRSMARHALDLPAEPLWLEQVHGPGVIDADLPWLPGTQPPRADAAVTRKSRTVLAVLVADCLPVLFAAHDGSAVGVAHAGWRGLAGGVLEATVNALAGHGALQAWLGPAIGPRYFEVGEEVRAAFMADDAGAAPAFRPNPRGRWQCDLKALARRRLTRLGVDAVHASDDCTYQDAARFYSYRRDGVTGRMAALIWRE